MWCVASARGHVTQATCTLHQACFFFQITPVPALRRLVHTSFVQGGVAAQWCGQTRCRTNGRPTRGQRPPVAVCSGRCAFCWYCGEAIMSIIDFIWWLTRAVSVRESAKQCHGCPRWDAAPCPGDLGGRGSEERSNLNHTWAWTWTWTKPQNTQDTMHTEPLSYLSADVIVEGGWIGHTTWSMGGGGSGIGSREPLVRTMISERKSVLPGRPCSSTARPSGTGSCLLRTCTSTAHCSSGGVRLALAGGSSRWIVTVGPAEDAKSR